MAGDQTVRAQPAPGYAFTNYGPQFLDAQSSVASTLKGARKELELTFCFDTLPTARNDSVIVPLPANAYINSGVLRVIELFAGGTSYDIGLSQPDGTVISANGIEDDLLLAEIDAVGETVNLGGALVGGTVDIGANQGQVVITPTGTFTAGKASLFLEYTVLADRSFLIV